MFKLLWVSFTFALLSILFLSSCASPQIWNPVCRHNVIYVASVVGEQYPVRFIVGDIWPQKKHVEVQAFIDNKWQYIKFDGSNITIVKRKSSFLYESSFIPTYVYSWNEYMNWFDERIINPNRWR